MTGGGPGPSALAGLCAALADWRRERETDAALTGLAVDAEWPALPALAEVHALAAGLRNREQVRRALAPAPPDAGPLNSDALVHRMFRLMHARAPGCLEHFTAYVDMLGALQALHDAAAPGAASTRGSAGTGPARKRAKPRPARKAASRPPAGDAPPG